MLTILLLSPIKPVSLLQPKNLAWYTFFHNTIVQGMLLKQKKVRTSSLKPGKGTGDLASGGNKISSLRLRRDVATLLTAMLLLRGDVSIATSCISDYKAARGHCSCLAWDLPSHSPACAVGERRTNTTAIASLKIYTHVHKIYNKIRVHV